MLKCPHGTTISIQLAQYGKVTADQKMCATGTTPATLSKNTSCLLPHTLQVSPVNGSSGYPSYRRSHRPRRPLCGIFLRCV
ncbi:UNVERIFIED_CONTAM: hypothetical protein PYX00_003512 [Menopon gallinae]|uniref:Uncharacterized protein n=1 Tax=Menopon gallinae TaxID=328185 RepID=A0AAW2I1V7_9NEOP